MYIRSAGLLVVVSSLLTGCSSSQQAVQTEASANETSNVQVQADPVAEQPVIESEAPKKVRRLKLRPTEPITESLNTPEPSTTTNQTAVIETSVWQPNEAHLARGGELIMGLQQDIGRPPSMNEMQTRLQTHMGLSSTQAQRVIVALGLRE